MNRLILLFKMRGEGCWMMGAGSVFEEVNGDETRIVHEKHPPFLVF